MTDFTEITLRENMRWDMVSYRAYGTVNKIPEIADANPTVPLSEEIPSGTKLYIPIIEDAEIVQTELLPPWKR